MNARKTEHFASEDWVDFVNGQLSGARSLEMQDHLNAGCEACSKSSGLWSRVGAAAKRESLYEAPDWALRYVRNAFTVAAAMDRTRGKLRMPQLILDSLWQTAAVGVRSGTELRRRLLYKSEEIAIEMQFDPELNSENVSVAGQVSNIALGGEGVAGIPIRLTSAHRRVVERSTNKLGEFSFSFVREKDLLFSLELQNGEQIAIPFCGTELASSDKQSS